MLADSSRSHSADIRQRVLRGDAQDAGAEPALAVEHQLGASPAGRSFSTAGQTKAPSSSNETIRSGEPLTCEGADPS